MIAKQNIQRQLKNERKWERVGAAYKLQIERKIS